MADLNADPSAFAKYQLALFERQTKNSNDILLKILSKIPIVKRWEQPLYKEATRRSVEIIGKLGIANPDQVVTPLSP